MTPEKFVEMAASLRFPSVFNPYADICPIFDLADAPALRRLNLLNHLRASLEMKVDAIWVGRDLGYRGGRRTGLALTDEANLAAFSRSFGERRKFVRATRGPIVAERTAGIVWRAILRLEKPVFTWNVFPLHPHEQQDSMTNRCHTRAERASVKPLLLALLDLLQPTKVVAIGNDAQIGLSDLGIMCIKVRHPSYGGVSEFESGISALNGLRVPKSEANMLSERLL